MKILVHFSTEYLFHSEVPTEVTVRTRGWGMAASSRSLMSVTASDKNNLGKN